MEPHGESSNTAPRYICGDGVRRDGHTVGMVAMNAVYHGYQNTNAVRYLPR